MQSSYESKWRRFEAAVLISVVSLAGMLVAFSVGLQIGMVL